MPPLINVPIRYRPLPTINTDFTSISAGGLGKTSYVDFASRSGHVSSDGMYYYSSGFYDTVSRLELPAKNSTDGISNATPYQNISLNDTAGIANFNDDGTQLIIRYASGNASVGGSYRVYDLQTPYDVSNKTLIDDHTFQLASWFDSEGYAISVSGSHILFSRTSSPNQYLLYEFPNGFGDLGTYIHKGTFTVSNMRAYGFALSHDGKSFRSIH